MNIAQAKQIGVKVVGSVLILTSLLVAFSLVGFINRRYFEWFEVFPGGSGSHQQLGLVLIVLWSLVCIVFFIGVQLFRSTLGSKD